MPEEYLELLRFATNNDIPVCITTEDKNVSIYDGKVREVSEERIVLLRRNATNGNGFEIDTNIITSIKFIIHKKG